MRDQARLYGKCEKGAQREQTFLARCSIPSQWARSGHSRQAQGRPPASVCRGSALAYCFAELIITAQSGSHAIVVRWRRNSSHSHHAWPAIHRRLCDVLPREFSDSFAGRSELSLQQPESLLQPGIVSRMLSITGSPSRARCALMASWSSTRSHSPPSRSQSSSWR